MFESGPAFGYHADMAMKEFPDAEKEWLEEEFFQYQPSRDDLVHLVEHYQDIVDHNTGTPAEAKAEFARRIPVLKAMIDLWYFRQDRKR